MVLNLSLLAALSTSAIIVLAKPFGFIDLTYQPEAAEHGEGGRRGVHAGGPYRPARLRNLDIADTRAKLDLYAATGLLSIGEGSHIFKLDSDKS